MNFNNSPNIPIAPHWALVVGSLGQGLILAALFLFVLSLVASIAERNAHLKVAGNWAFSLGGAALFGAFACLAALFIKNQFEFQYVFDHGGADTGLKYKIAGVWTAQEGSFLLWACTSALFGLLALRFTGIYRRWYVAVYSLFLGTLSAILAYETPFHLMKEAVAHGKVFQLPDGAGMTPSLQNYWVVVHPPTIFTGFGSLTVPMAFAVAAMLTGHLDDWVHRVRPWALLTVGILGLGICMGGLWAYETQGWGGFWAWDPVEIASFVPWLCTVAFIHGVIVQVTRGRWKGANLLLAGLPFLAFVYGTFLTRSGLLDKVSVHSFASMDQSALVILRWFMILFTGGFLLLWATRGLKLARQASTPEPDGVHRESLYRMAALMVTLLAACLAVGMSWPLISGMMGKTISAIDQGLWDRVTVWFFIPILILAALTPYIGWEALTAREIWKRISTPFFLALGFTGFSIVAIEAPGWGMHVPAGAKIGMPFGLQADLVPWMAVLIFVCVFSVVANLSCALEVARRSKLGIGGFVSHLGVAVLMAGLILSRGFEQKARLEVTGGSSAKAMGYTVSYAGRSNTSLHDRSSTAYFDVTTPSGDTLRMKPGLYYYFASDGEEKPMVWPAIRHGFSHDLYLSLLPPVLQAWQNPISFKPGQSSTVDGVTVSYLRPTQQGIPGAMGTKFGGIFTVAYQGGTYKVNPTIELTQNGLIPSLPQAGPDFRLALVGAVNPADRSAQMMLMFTSPIFPIELFYKPMTILVWLGAGIIFLGGVMSAWYRRYRPVLPSVPVAPIVPSVEREPAIV